MKELFSRMVEGIKIDGNIEKSVWRKVKPVELVSSVTGRRTKVRTEVRFCHSKKYLYLAYNVFDERIFATYRLHDQPLWQEEAVEVFIGPGKSWPKDYFEFQFSSLGTSFDAKVKNPSGNRHKKGFKVDTSWNCQGLLVAAKVYPHTKFLVSGVYELRKTYKNTKYVKRPNLASGRWTVEVAIPWQEILPKGKKISQVPFWRLNFLRIDGYPKQTHFLSYKPTYKNPADFHLPQNFALLKLES